MWLRLGSVVAASSCAMALGGARDAIAQTGGDPVDAATAEVLIEASRAPAPSSSIDPIEVFDADFVDRTDAFTADEVLSQMRSRLPDARQVVLINGQESLIDLSSIPAPLIQRIEVSTTGVMPNGSPRIVGNVVNIILKDRYDGANLDARLRNTMRGGGDSSDVNALGGHTLNELSAILNFTHREQQSLLASERDFSRVQNYTSLGGTDYRDPYGTVPVLRAVMGSLDGIADAEGNPASIALAPRFSSSQALRPQDFIAAPPGTLRAAGLRRFNTAEFLDLIHPSKADLMKGNLTFAASPDTKVHAEYSYGTSESVASSPPPMTAIGTGAVVPAAYSPFDQDVEVGLVHAGFGAVRHWTSTGQSTGKLAAEGRADRWRWNSLIEVSRRRMTGRTHDLDPAKFAASLAAADPTERFDPFAGDAPGSANAELYPRLTRIRWNASTATDTKLHADTQGEISKGWVGPLTLNVGVDRSTRDNRQTLDPADSTSTITGTRVAFTSSRLSAALDVPVFKVLSSPAVLTVSTYASREQQDVMTQAVSGALPSTTPVRTTVANSLLTIPWATPSDARNGAFSVQTRVGFGLSRVDGESYPSAEVGAIWAPLKAVSLRGEYSRQVSPSPSAGSVSTSEYQTLMDRRGAGAVVSNVEIIDRGATVQSPPRSARLTLAADWTLPTLEGFHLTLSYSESTQDRQLQKLSAQEVLDNEAALPDRVIRLPPTSQDIAAGLSGQVVLVDTTPFNGGRRDEHKISVQSRYFEKTAQWGAVALSGSVNRTLSVNNEIVPGRQLITTDGQKLPPAWAFSGEGDWQRGSVGIHMWLTYAGKGAYAGLPYSSFTTLDVKGNYQLRKVRIAVGVQNLFDRRPPFANTLTGFGGGSPLGRSYSLMIRSAIGG